MRAKARSTKPPVRSRHSIARRERFAARLTSVQKDLFQRAAELSGRSLTEFVLNAAQTVAEETIRDYQVLELTAREAEAFLAAIENPPRLNPKLENLIHEQDEDVEPV